MLIEIKKVRLTKTSVSQMFFISIKNLDKAKALGMLINVRKKHPKVMLLKFEDDYYLFDMDWRKDREYFYRSWGRWSSSITFDNEKECEYSWKIFTEVRDEASKNHIYI